MADKEKKEKDTENEPKKEGFLKGNMTLVIFAVIAMLLMIGVGAGAFYLGTKSSANTAEASTAETEELIAETVSVPNKVEPPGPMVPINEFLINLLDKDNNRYLKATMTLEVDSEETMTEIQNRTAQIRDAILLLTGNKTFGELRDMQGKMQLRAELIGHLNTLLETGRVKHIYFTNFVIQ